jgi:hypothetical protein
VAKNSKPLASNILLLFGGGCEEIQEDEIMCEGASRVGQILAGRSHCFCKLRFFLKLLGVQNERLNFWLDTLKSDTPKNWGPQQNRTSVDPPPT